MEALSKLSIDASNTDNFAVSHNNYLTLLTLLASNLSQSSLKLRFASLYTLLLH
ncbi:hypothetical protein EGR_08596 [Echinococcus granulosus]|uniref:Uncharacterized protein n=1 Tax=Echinococcus granulosus TaxID=6210 RepID=W6U620_ECHGR|nr:hypothetical protein EGR_08596 [Echinococcus granulosus]EUB56570.1 hypothetical protein EGR_08596 [Echinococcus granulosus]